MNKIFVSGLINTETTVKIDSFPIQYCPILYPFFGVETAVSGVGFNMAKALTVLGDDVTIFSLTGSDDSACMIKQTLLSCGVSCKYIDSCLKSTPQSVVLYDKDGKRQIYCDLKDIQETQCSIPKFEEAAAACDIAVLCNVNYNRPLLKLAKEMGKTVATDVHVVSDLYDAFNADFMRYADILFMSDEAVKGDPKDFIREIAGLYGNEIIVMGLGSKGALLYTKESNEIILQPAVKTRDVVNTIGAGDALFSSFLHNFAKTKNPAAALRFAVTFASYKIGESGAARGFADEQTILGLME